MDMQDLINRMADKMWNIREEVQKKQTVQDSDIESIQKLTYILQKIGRQIDGYGFYNWRVETILKLEKTLENSDSWFKFMVHLEDAYSSLMELPEGFILN